MYQDEGVEPRRARGQDRDESVSREKGGAGVTRVWHRPRTGTKVTTLVALAALACAGYFLLAPVYMDTASGWFGCGNALTGTSDDFTTNVCGGAPSLNRARAILMLVVALLVGGLGARLFGFDREVETRSEPPRRLGGRGQRGRRADRDHSRSMWDD